MADFLRTHSRLWAILLAIALATACGGGANDASTDGDADAGDAGNAGDDGADNGDDGGSTPPGALALRILDAGEMSGVTYASTWTAKTQAEYDALWAAHRPIGVHTQFPVDFQTEIVVAVFVGERVSSGFGAEFVAAAPQGDGAVVLWNETYPGANCPPGLPVVTHAYALAAMTRVEGAVAYTGGTRPIPCP